jgi:hypothetical protein
LFDDMNLAEDFLKSEMPEVRIGHHQLISTENVTTSIGLPDHLKGHQVRGGSGAKDAQRFA